MDEKLFDLICEVVFKVTGKARLTYDTDFVQDLALSSFDLMNIVSAFEEMFDVDIPNKDVWNLHQVQDVIQYMKDRGMTELMDE